MVNSIKRTVGFSAWNTAFKLEKGRMNKLILLRTKNAVLGRLFPDQVAKQAAQLFLTPRTHPQKTWEIDAELQGTRVSFGEDLSAVIWGEDGQPKVLLMHGWEGRATQLYALAEPLVASGFQVIAIDAPQHGKSGGAQSHPVAFAKAILTAGKALGPFAGAVGHSMGGAAIAIAQANGLALESTVLIASPARILDTLNAFAGFIGLPPGCTKHFIGHIEEKVGQPARNLDLVEIFSRLKPVTLLVHSQDDLEVPVQASEQLHNCCSTTDMVLMRGLGHRRIVRDAGVAECVSQFLQKHLLLTTVDTGTLKNPAGLEETSNTIEMIGTGE